LPPKSLCRALFSTLGRRRQFMERWMATKRNRCRSSAALNLPKSRPSRDPFPTVAVCWFSVRPGGTPLIPLFHSPCLIHDNL